MSASSWRLLLQTVGVHAAVTGPRARDGGCACGGVPTHVSRPRLPALLRPLLFARCYRWLSPVLQVLFAVVVSSVCPAAFCALLVYALRRSRPYCAQCCVAATVALLPFSLEGRLVMIADCAPCPPSLRKFLPFQPVCWSAPSAASALRTLLVCADTSWQCTEDPLVRQLVARAGSGGVYVKAVVVAALEPVPIRMGRVSVAVLM